MPQSPLVAFNGQKLGSTSYVAAKYGKQRELWTGNRHGKYYAGSYGGLSGFAANQASATLAVGLATTYTGLVLSNAAANTVNLVVQKVGFTALTSAANTFGLALGSSASAVTHTTPATIYSNIAGASATGLVGTADVAATLPAAPVYAKFLLSVATTTQTGGFFDIDGELVIPPGAYMAIVGTGGTTGFWGSISWEEVPV